jgi:hypothetical protein
VPSRKARLAAGPYADYTDFFHNFALYEHSNESNQATRPYFQTFANTLQLLLNGHISPTIATSFHSTYFLALQSPPLTFATSAPLASVLPSTAYYAPSRSTISMMTSLHTSSPAAT